MVAANQPKELSKLSQPNPGPRPAWSLCAVKLTAFNGNGRLRVPGDEAGDDEHGGDLGRVAEAIVGQAGVGARVLAPRRGDPQGTLSGE